MTQVKSIALCSSLGLECINQKKSSKMYILAFKYLIKISAKVHVMK